VSRKGLPLAHVGGGMGARGVGWEEVSEEIPDSRLRVKKCAP